MCERFDIDVSYRDPWDPPDPLPLERPHPSEYEDLPVLPDDLLDEADRLAEKGSVCPLEAQRWLRERGE